MIRKRFSGFLVAVSLLTAWIALLNGPAILRIEKNEAIRLGFSLDKYLIAAFKSDAVSSVNIDRIHTTGIKVKHLALLVKNSYVYHSKTEKIGRNLNPRDLADKSIYDGIRKLKHRYRTEKDTRILVLKVSEKQNDQRILRIFMPLIDENQVVGAAVSEIQETPRSSRWTPVIAGIITILFGLFFINVRLKQYAGYMFPALLAILFLYFWIYIPGERLDFFTNKEENDVLLQRIEQLFPSSVIETAAHIDGHIDPETSGELLSPLPSGLKWIGLLIAYASYWFFSSGRSGRAFKAFLRHRLAYAYTAPAMTGMILLVLIPLLYGVVLAFLHVGRDGWEFVGIANFRAILSDFHITRPDNFYFTFAVTVLWTVSNVALHVGIGLGLALILNKSLLRWKRFYRVLLILPWAIPNYITALIWKGMFHRQFGAINALLELAGFHAISWFNHFWTAFLADLITNVWLGFPFMMVVSLGALQSIPGELYEAAAIDGASKKQQFRHITLPLLKSALFPAIILGTIWTFNMFNIIYLVSGGAPEGATDILIVDAYRWAFQKYNYGYAAAYSLIIFAVLFTYSVITNRITRATEGAFD